MNDPILPGARGGAVVHVHRRLVVLGIDVPASELREDRFGPGTEVAIRRLQAELGLPVTGVVDAATAQRLGLPGSTPRVVQGIVCKPDGTPLPGVAVQLVQPHPHGDAALAEAKSGTEGEFTFAWPAGVSGGLKIRASGGEAEPVPAGSPGGTAWVRLSIGGEYRGVARFTALTVALRPALHRGPAHALGGHGRASELKEVAAVTGVPVPDVSRFELAHKLSEQTKVDPAEFFALFARRIPAPLQAALEPDGEVPAVLDDVQVARVLDTILQLRPETIEIALRDAARDNVIAGLDLAETAARLRALRLESIAALPFRVGKTPLRDVLATVVLDRAAQNAVIEAYEAHGTDKAFWTALEASGALSAEARDALRFTLRTAVLLRNHLPLLKRVQAMRAEGKIASTADLARLDAADWGALIRETDPAGEGLTFTANLKGVRDPRRAARSLRAPARGVFRAPPSDRGVRGPGRQAWCGARAHRARRRAALSRPQPDVQPAPHAYRSLPARPTGRALRHRGTGQGCRGPEEGAARVQARAPVRAREGDARGQVHERPRRLRHGPQALRRGHDRLRRDGQGRPHDLPPRDAGARDEPHAPRGLERLLGARDTLGRRRAALGRGGRAARRGLPEPAVALRIGGLLLLRALPRDPRPGTAPRSRSTRWGSS